MRISNFIDEGMAESVCFNCGSNIKQGGIWYGVNQEVTVCPDDECIKSIIKLSIDSISDAMRCEEKAADYLLEIISSESNSVDKIRKENEENERQLLNRVFEMSIIENIFDKKKEEIIKSFKDFYEDMDRVINVELKSDKYEVFPKLDRFLDDFSDLMCGANSLESRLLFTDYLDGSITYEEFKKESIKEQRRIGDIGYEL